MMRPLSHLQNCVPQEFSSRELLRTDSLGEVTARIPFDVYTRIVNLDLDCVPRLTEESPWLLSIRKSSGDIYCLQVSLKEAIAVIAKVTWEPGNTCLITLHGHPHRGVALTVRRSALLGLLSNYTWGSSGEEQLFDPWDTKAIVEAKRTTTQATPQLVPLRPQPLRPQPLRHHPDFPEFDWLEASAFLLNVSRAIGIIFLTYWLFS